MTSSSVVLRPSVRRTEPSASSGATPIAKITADALSWPSWHAEPVDAAISGALAKKALPLAREADVECIRQA